MKGCKAVECWEAAFCVDSLFSCVVLVVVPQRCDQRERHARGPHEPALLQHRPHLRVPPRLPQRAGPEAGSLVRAPRSVCGR